MISQFSLSIFYKHINDSLARKIARVIRKI
jgi:hypothetical protein